MTCCFPSSKRTVHAEFGTGARCPSAESSGLKIEKCNFSSPGLLSNPSNLGAKIEDFHHKTKLHLTWGHFQEAVQLEKSPEEIQKERTVRYELRCGGN